jgi:hypothetical protein
MQVDVPDYARLETNTILQNMFLHCRFGAICTTCAQIDRQKLLIDSMY